MISATIYRRIRNTKRSNLQQTVKFWWHPVIQAITIDSLNQLMSRRFHLLSNMSSMMPTYWSNTLPMSTTPATPSCIPQKPSTPTIGTKDATRCAPGLTRSKRTRRNGTKGIVADGAIGRDERRECQGVKRPNGPCRLAVRTGVQHVDRSQRTLEGLPHGPPSTATPGLTEARRPSLRDPKYLDVAKATLVSELLSWYIPC